MKKSIIINNCVINYFEENNGKQPIVFFHGFNSSSVSFDSLLKVKNREYDIIFVDMPGSGKSTTNEKLSIEFYNETMKLFLEKIGHKNYILFGHSLGGATVAFLAKNSNVIMGVLASPFNPFINEFIPIEFLNKILKPENLSEALFSAKELVFNKEKQFYFDNIDTTAKTFYNFIKNTQDKYKFILENQILSIEYQNTTLTKYYHDSQDKLIGISGKNDLIVPIKSLDAVTKEFGIEFTYFDNCGHAIVYEQTDKVNAFLNDLVKRGQ